MLAGLLVSYKTYAQESQLSMQRVDLTDSLALKWLLTAVLVLPGFLSDVPGLGAQAASVRALSYPSAWQTAL